MIPIECYHQTIKLFPGYVRDVLQRIDSPWGVGPAIHDCADTAVVAGCNYEDWTLGH